MIWKKINKPHLHSHLSYVFMISSFFTSEGGFRNQPHRRSRNLQTTSPSKTTTTTSNTSSPSKATSSPTPTSEYAPALPPKTYLDPDQDSGMGASTDQSYHELPNYNQYNVVSRSCLSIFNPPLYVSIGMALAPYNHLSVIRGIMW